MSGYLEVKYPFRSNLGLNPFKSWKRQWCILRPSATCGGGSLAVYCSEAGAAAGSVELPSDCVVKRAKSRSRPHAFAVFSAREPGKPRVLLAGQTLQDTQHWMDKIRELLSGDNLLGTEKLFKDSYSVSVVATDLSRKCHLPMESVLTLSSNGLLISRPHTLGMFMEWKHMSDVLLSRENGDRHRTCTITVDSGFSEGAGELKFSSALAGALAGAVRRALRPAAARRRSRRSRSDGDLRAAPAEDTGEVRRSSWYSGPSEISLDDTDLVMSKAAQRIPRGPLARCSGAGDFLQLAALPYDDSASDRVSLVSVSSLASISSGVYEEIPEPHEPQPQPREPLRCELRDLCDEPTYESVAECIYATMRRSARRAAPPLPPRHPFGTMKLGESWSSRVNSAGAGGCGAGGCGAGGCGAGCAGDAAGVTRHSSLGSLPRHCKPLPKARQPFSVFRKRLKSDSRIATSPKSETAKENKDLETKKKKFDFPPPRDIFKSFKVSRKMKNLKITPGSLAKSETKSCEFLEDGLSPRPPRRAPPRAARAPARQARSAECLEHDELDDFPDLAEVAALALPQEIVELIVRGRALAGGPGHGGPGRAGPALEGDYVPMSPVAPADLDHHYIVMSPRTHLA